MLARLNPVKIMGFVRLNQLLGDVRPVASLGSPGAFKDKGQEGTHRRWGGGLLPNDFVVGPLPRDGRYLLTRARNSEISRSWLRACSIIFTGFNRAPNKCKVWRFLIQSLIILSASPPA